jgi:hypothetical protein
MSLSREDIALVGEALQLYVQVISKQAPPQHVNQLVSVVQNLFHKIESMASIIDSSGKPNNISDEWFEKVCVKCKSLSRSGCTDKVTEKFPGKCDPILHYEKGKNLIIGDNK